MLSYGERGRLTEFDRISHSIVPQIGDDFFQFRDLGFLLDDISLDLLHFASFIVLQLCHFPFNSLHFGLSIFDLCSELFSFLFEFSDRLLELLNLGDDLRSREYISQQSNSQA